ncbi:dihydroorotate dehydrogenase 1B [Methanocaldococcus villosus KIN24-T80]|uniref:Dihydroorotate dehydrogenase n=1 Tax=Methanocaldococcus villosus KIN24-T80 TaxID=1069083 RepID=N6VXU2_9EURY|nr:dihydroorotate dehydrogenase [Methanocaldococcus villosus]ENN95957.1 dihydroorotate dehydrogenase 1B [Methanocaldococcus villosus KIN24-T80]
MEIKLCGIKFKNPIFLASGIMGDNAGALKRIAINGAGAVTTKSIGLKPNMGHKNPVIVELDEGFLNAVGLANPGVDNYIEELKKIRGFLDKIGVRIIASIYGKDEEEFKEVAKKIEPYVDMIELNISCPHAKGYGLEIGQDVDLSYNVCKSVKSAVNIPVFAKISPMVNIREIAEALCNVVDGFTAINTVKGMVIDINMKKPILSNKFGGLSGKYIKPIGVRVVYELYEYKKPIIGVGGIFNGRDALEYFMAGASAVQIGSAVYFRGYDVFNKIYKEIKEFLDKEGLELKDIIGIAHE